MGISPDALYQNLLLDLSSQGFDTDLYKSLSSLWPDATIREAAAFSIQKSLLKKLQVENSRPLDDAALEKFLAINSRCGKWEPRFADSWDEVLVGELRRSIYEFFHLKGGVPIFDSLDEFLHHGRTGPGASIGARGGDFYTKMFASPLTCTRQGLYLAYKNYTRNFPEWSNAEIIRSLNFGEARVVAGNRLSFVPKDDKISRSICIEPSLNMFFQLGAGHVIERRLLSAFGLSMADQPLKNRELARRGSLDQGYVTCDLSSASDSLSIKMLEYVLPKHVMNMLKFLRSPVSDIRGTQVELNMISTMGNGFTFPLQTMLFSAVVVSAFRARGLNPEYPRGVSYGNWGVFGDDIVCPQTLWTDVRRLLDFLGFQVNHDKTFVEGPFKESCGSDFFRGVNVRGVYVKRLRSMQDSYAVINQLNLFSARTGISLPKSVQYLLRFVERLYIPRWDNFDSGLMVPQSMLPILQYDKHTQSIAYRRYEPIGQRLRITENAIISPKRSKPRIYNPSGLFMSFLQRSVNSYSIGVRHDITRYKRKLGIAPFWDARPTVHLLTGWFPWQRWDTAVYLNFYC